MKEKDFQLYSLFLTQKKSLSTIKERKKKTNEGNLATHFSWNFFSV